MAWWEWLIMLALWGAALWEIHGLRMALQRVARSADAKFERLEERIWDAQQELKRAIKMPY